MPVDVGRRALKTLSPVPTIGRPSSSVSCSPVLAMPAERFVLVGLLLERDRRRDVEHVARRRAGRPRSSRSPRASSSRSRVFDRLLPRLAAGREALGDQRCGWRCGSARPWASPTRAPTCRDTAARSRQCRSRLLSPPRSLALLLGEPQQQRRRVLSGKSLDGGRRRPAARRGRRPRCCQHRAARGVGAAQRAASSSASGAALVERRSLRRRGRARRSPRRPPRPGSARAPSRSARLKPGHLVRVDLLGRQHAGVDDARAAVDGQLAPGQLGASPRRPRRPRWAARARG